MLGLLDRRDTKNRYLVPWYVLQLLPVYLQHRQCFSRKLCVIAMHNATGDEGSQYWQTSTLAAVTLKMHVSLTARLSSRQISEEEKLVLANTKS